MILPIGFFPRGVSFSSSLALFVGLLRRAGVGVFLRKSPLFRDKVVELLLVGRVFGVFPLQLRVLPHLLRAEFEVAEANDSDARWVVSVLHLVLAQVVC